MYLSRLMLNPRSRRVQREVAAPYELHRSVMRAFPERLDRAAERVLYRLDADPRSGGLTLLVQSQTMPDWSWLEEPEARGYLAPVDGPNPAVKPFSPSFSPGQVLVFRLRANPTKKLCHAQDQRAGRQGNIRDGLRVGIYQEEEQVQWLRRKAEQGGFEVLQVRLTPEGMRYGLIHRPEHDEAFKFLAVRFDGLLRVTEPERFLETVRAGIGSGKGFGFGLLSLARPDM